MKLNEALRRTRKEKKATQAQAAQAAGVSVTMYQLYEYGRSEPTASVLIALADYFGVSLDYLAGHSDDPAHTCSNSQQESSDAYDHIDLEHSQRILNIISEKQLTPYRVAKDTGISMSLFGKWKEKPTSKISSEKLVLIADYLGCSVDYLLGRTENPEVNQ